MKLFPHTFPVWGIVIYIYIKKKKRKEKLVPSQLIGNITSLLRAQRHQLDNMFYCRRLARPLARSFQSVKRKRSDADARKETRGHSSPSAVICSLAGDLAAFFGILSDDAFPSMIEFTEIAAIKTC